ncbi:MAG: GNAT family N-acetyltransferase [Comamonadaceae bacterium]|nr:MAG: GNAT family N-acetyltransferase [Comamonadaceae bacterium]
MQAPGLLKPAAESADPKAFTPRRRYTLTPAADLAVFYAADAARFVGKGCQDVLDVVTPAAFTHFYASCPSIGFACDGQAIGGVIFDGEKAHIAVQAEHHGRWAFLLRPACDWLFRLNPRMLIDIEPDNHLCIRFMDRNGWTRIETPGAPPGTSLTFLMTPQHGERWRRGR